MFEGGGNGNAKNSEIGKHSAAISATFIYADKSIHFTSGLLATDVNFLPLISHTMDVNSSVIQSMASLPVIITQNADIDRPCLTTEFHLYELAGTWASWKGIRYKMPFLNLIQRLALYGSCIPTENSGPDLACCACMCGVQKLHGKTGTKTTT